ncbi:MAG: hypothetical protein QOE77_3025 [Blastocatellia bacterium]|jgi:hypothetical protein|nr:hypothetical protein [Blastocatellia bacterium]
MRRFTLAVLLICSSTSVLAHNPIILMTVEMTIRMDGSPEPRLEPIAVFEHGKFQTPRGVDNKEAAAFIKKFLPKGQKLYVVFGGGAAGTANLSEAWLGCNDRIFASAPLNPGALAITRLRGQVQGLATNSDMIARSEIWRRAPSAAERAAATGLAKSGFANHGATAAQIAKMQIANLTAIDVDGDNRAELVGTFRIMSPDTEHPPRYVFLIAEGEGANYKPAVLTYRDFSKSEIFNIGEETLVDYVDVDRDGTAEIVASFSNDRASGYHIYRRLNGEWKVAYENTIDFCKSEGGR